MGRGLGLRRFRGRSLEDVASTDGRREVLRQCFGGNAHSLNGLFSEAYDLSRKHFSNLIHFYMPGMVRYETSFYRANGSHQFPGISVTGRFCHLECDHCNGQLLETMIPATTPMELLSVCTEIKNQGGTGCLISGGCLNDGKVPLMKFVPTIKRVNRDLGLRTVIHTGLVDASVAKALANAGIAAAMIDIIGSNDTVREVYHLNDDVRSFDRSLSLLDENGIPTVPHVVVGIHYGELKGEKTALEMISKHNRAAVVVVALTPLSNTEMEHASPPLPVDVARVVLASRLLMPETPLLLGCARPRGQHKVETDILAIKAGVNGIAYPSEEAHAFAKKLGLSVRLHEKCCSLLWQDLAPQTSPASA